MKKLIAILLVMVFSLTLFGCGVQQAPGVTTEPVSSLTESSYPEEEECALPSAGAVLPDIIQPEPADDTFVPVLDYIPDLVVDLRYASEDNFTGKQIYPFRDAYLRYGTVKRLLMAQEILVSQGLGLKLWDAFRPVSAQFALWETCPDPRYVADPRTGNSSHSRGNTVDITLVDASGRELTMPTSFDDFSALADRDYSDCTEEAAKNALLLQSVMEEAGFKGYSGEWWHFSDVDTYPVEEHFEPLEAHLRLPVCEEYIALYLRPATGSDVLTRIPRNSIFTVLARQDGFLLVSFEGLRGYVPEGDTQMIE